jgi:hypothetical protein
MKMYMPLARNPEVHQLKRERKIPQLFRGLFK